MSHYSVLIIGKDPERQLYPYEELAGEEDPDPDRTPSDPRLEFAVDVPAGEFEAKAREIIANLETEGVSSPSAGLSERYRRLLDQGRAEDILAHWFGGQKRRNGDWGRYRNPNAQWDWFRFGGRWAGKLLLKPGRSGVLSPESREKGAKFSPSEVDRARFGDVDWEATRKAFSPFAVLKRGEWHAQGGMGWFGIAFDCKPDAEWEDEIDGLLKEIPDRDLVSVYDCHI
jgi:hypothetical protein